MKVLSVAYPFAPVTAGTAGGAEQVLFNLDRALVHQGHESVVIAAAGSRVAGRVVELPAMAGGPITDEVRQVVWAHTRAAIASALARERFDLVHLHGIDFHEYLPESGTPTLVTLHLPLSWYPAHALEPRPNVWLHCVSSSQQVGAQLHEQFLSPIPNGVNLHSFWPRERKHRYLLIAGRICPEKAPHLGLDAARMAGWPALLAGEVYPYESHVRYFEREVKPRLGRFVGAVGGERKRRLFAGAAALLVPSQAPETSSLVAMEAMASGTPVIAFDSGALPSLICDGFNGFVVRGIEEMARAIGQLRWIRPSSCRAFAEARFDFRRTASAYFERYRELATA